MPCFRPNTIVVNLLFYSIKVVAAVAADESCFRGDISLLRVEDRAEAWSD